MLLDTLTRPRLTRFDDVRELVRELLNFGIDGSDLYRYATDVAVVDLDMLNEVLSENRSQNGETPLAA